MAFTHNFGQTNVVGSINYFIRSNLGNSLPDWLTWSYGSSQPRTLNFYWPDQPLSFPSFSVTHYGSDPKNNFEGDKADGVYKGIERMGTMEVNCWDTELIQNRDGSQEKNEKWMLHLQTMRDMVFLLFQKNRSIPIYNCTDPNNLVSLNALVRFRDIREAATAPDNNPAVRRVRILITYEWVERWT